jgi:hypothetical protein
LWYVYTGSRLSSIVPRANGQRSKVLVDVPGSDDQIFASTSRMMNIPYKIDNFVEVRSLPYQGNYIKNNSMTRSNLKGLKDMGTHARDIFQGRNDPNAPVTK